VKKKKLTKKQLALAIAIGGGLYYFKDGKFYYRDVLGLLSKKN